MAITKKHLEDVCMAYSGNQQCRYLDEDVNGKGDIVYICKKLSPDRQIIDEEVDQFLKEMAANGQDPHKQGVPLGDNCQGYIKLTTKPQGYDVGD